MSKYLIVTGGAGFIGSNLIELLVRKTKDQIISIDNYSTGSKTNHIKSNRVKYINNDTQNFDKILKNYKKKISAVFHFAEFSRIYQSFNNVNECFASNIKGTNQVINFCLKHNIKIIYSATSASLGKKGSDQNLSPYAFTKSTNMNLIMNLNKWFNFSYEIIYFYNVYGPRQILSSKMAAVIGIFEKCFKKNEPLPIVLPGTQTRRFTHVRDTVNICYLAWKKNKNAHYSISSKKSYSIKYVAKLFSKNIKYIPERRGERFKSTIVKKIRNKKIYNYTGKSELKNYIVNFKNRG
jgi:UDP-glucose 4-epimerase